MSNYLFTYIFKSGGVINVSGSVRGRFESQPGTCPQIFQKSRVTVSLTRGKYQDESMLRPLQYYSIIAIPPQVCHNFPS